MNKLLLIVLAVGVFVVEVTMIPADREKRSDDGGPLEAVVQQLSQQFTSLAAQLNSVNAQLNFVNNDLSALKTRIDSPVAFYAMSSVNPIHTADGGTLVLNHAVTTTQFTKALRNLKLDSPVAFYAMSSVNPIQTADGGTLVLNHAVTNVGNAYNTLSGIFTAPVPGLYHFHATILSYHRGDNQHAYAGIYVDSERMATGISDTGSGYHDQTTISVIVHLFAGQRVYVKNVSGAAKDYRANGVDDPYTTFSGLLIHGD